MKEVWPTCLQNIYLQYLTSMKQVFFREWMLFYIHGLILIIVYHDRKICIISLAIFLCNFFLKKNDYRIMVTKLEGKKDSYVCTANLMVS